MADSDRIFSSNTTIVEYYSKTEEYEVPLHRSQSTHSLSSGASLPRRHLSMPPGERGHAPLERYLYDSTTARPREDSKTHHAKLGEFAATLWKENDLTDVHVKVEDKVFPAHRAVLSCYSPFFKRNLQSTQRVSQVYTIRLTDIIPDAFKVLLQYMYTGKLKVTCQNIGQVYEAARKLEMLDAQHQCAEILRGNVRSPANSLFIYVTCKNLKMDSERERTLKVILERFEDIVVTHDFLHLDIGSLMDILSSDYIGARSEMVLYLAALKWLHHRRKDRAKYSVRLLKCIRFPLMNLDEILASYYPPLMTHLTEIPEIRQMLLEATCYISSKMAGLERCFQSYSARPRRYLIQKDPMTLWDICKHDVSKNATSKQDISQPDDSEQSHDVKNAAAKIIQKKYRRYIGRKRQRSRDKHLDLAARRIQAVWRGHRTRRNLKPLFVYSKASEGPKTLLDSMTADPCLHLLLYHRNAYDRPDVMARPPGSHRYFSTKHLPKVEGPIQIPDADVLFLSGGINPLRPDDAVSSGSMILRCYHGSNEWQRCGKMPIYRHHHCMAYVRGDIYVIGGCDPRITFRNRMVATATCFRYNLKKKDWRQMSHMHHARMYHGAAVLNDVIYVIGGKNECGSLLSSVECYTPELDQWLELESHLCCPRMGMGVTAYRNMIWVVGGMVQPVDVDKIYLVRDLECYDPQTNKWVNGKARMPVPKCFLTLVASNDQLYAIGGVVRNNSNPNRLYLSSVTDVLRYDSDANRWKLEVELPSPRHNVAATILGNTLFCIGGLSSEEMTPLSEVVIRDSHMTTSWDYSSPLPMSLVGCAAITIPNAIDVAFKPTPFS